MKKLNCILLIEDNEFTNIYNQRLIKNSGIAEYVYVTENGEEALDFIFRRGKFSSPKTEYHSPDLIFLDINLPGMNAWEFIEEYRKLKTEKTTQAKIVMLTTSPNPNDEKKSKLINEVICFNRKPLTKIILEQIMKEYY